MRIRAFGSGQALWIPLAWISRLGL